MTETIAAVSLRNGDFTYQRTLTRSPHDDQHHTYMQARYEIYYLVSGNVIYQVEDRNYTLNPGDIIILNNREMHRPYFASDSEYERIILFFTPEFCSPYSHGDYSLLQYFERKKPGSFNWLPSRLVEQAQLARFFSEIEEHQRSGHPARDLMIETAFIRLLIRINDVIASQVLPTALDGDYNARIEQIVSYIHQHLYKPLTLQHIEEQFHMNRYHFSHLFKRMTGFSFKQYITHKRIAKAIELLKLRFPPGEVCAMTGFEDYSNFYKAFRKITGVSPANYV
ncbi:helix-turn-helix domain-containing protein [Paenibacillus sacheonensis]|uniref:Helix-turn-helix domain-containing protein n=1 Tax=Paenibacillus sacheonensis TaxID=742054 RepID=A0A7X4YM37_9BACL|nr:AraC family transcriptional regulator [Paenibacillus sacheonensis]MBM7565817.1 AraC-like DNA-binding protein [Paenibacillus sacheonensis]NBC68863.1 helix-turn-helix domain-containing protein [Paenibacillus sacheonensis]